MADAEREGDDAELELLQSESLVNLEAFEAVKLLEFID